MHMYMYMYTHTHTHTHPFLYKNKCFTFSALSSLPLVVYVSKCFTLMLYHGKAERNFEFIGEDKDRQLESLWKDTGIGDVLPWEDIANEVKRLLEMRS
jgi:hypothetical protein